jgi:tetratricopeptide (TPR) repeat protein
MRLAALLIALMLTVAAAPSAAQDPARIQADVRRGQALMAEGRALEAEPLLSRAADDAAALWGDASPDAGSLRLLQANAVEDQGRLVEAEALYRRALTALERSTPPGHPRRGWALNDLGLNLHRQGRHAEALVLLEAAVDLRTRTEGPEAGPTLTSLGNMGSVLRALGRFGASADAQRQVLGVRERTLAPDDPDLALTLNNLGAVLLDLDQPAEAEPLLRRAADIRAQALGEDDPLTAQTLILLAEALTLDGRTEAAWAIQDRALTALRAGDAPLDLAAALGARADLAQNLGRLDDALVAAEAALALRRAHLPPGHPEIAASLASLGDVHLAAGRPGMAAPLLTESLEMVRSALGTHHINGLRPLTLLAIAEGELGQPDRALDRFAQAAALAETALPPDHLGRTATTADLGAGLAAARRPLEALPHLRRAGADLIRRRGATGRTDGATRREADHLRHLWRLTVTAAWDAAHPG